MDKIKTNQETNIVNFPAGDTEDTAAKNSMRRSKSLNRTQALRRFLAVAAAAVIIAAIAAFASGDSSFKSTNSVNPEPISLLNSENYCFSDYKEGYILASDGRISCFNTNQELQWEITASKTAPTVKANGKYALTYYNKDNLAVLTDGKNTRKIKTDGNVIYGSVNRGGFCTLIIEEDGFKNQVAVYNNEGKSVYKWHNSDKYITSAVLSDNNKLLALSEMKLTDNDVSSNVLLTDIRKDSGFDELSLGSSVICEINFVSKNNFAVILDDKTLCYSASKRKKWEIDYSGKNLYTYDTSDKNIIALVFGEDDSALSSSIVKYYNHGGKLIGSFKTKSRVETLDIRGRTSLLTYNKEIAVVNTKGKELSKQKTDVDMHKCIFMGNKKCALVVSGSSAALTKTR